MIGIFLGGILAYRFYGDRLTNAGWLPEQKVKQRLASTLVAARPEARGALEGSGLQLSDLRTSMPNASVDLGKSRRTDDSIYYHVETDVQGGKAVMVIAVLRDFDRDTTATLWEFVRK